MSARTSIIAWRISQHRWTRSLPSISPEIKKQMDSDDVRRFGPKMWTNGHCPSKNGGAF